MHSRLSPHHHHVTHLYRHEQPHFSLELYIAVAACYVIDTFTSPVLAERHDPPRHSLLFRCTRALPARAARTRLFSRNILLPFLAIPFSARPSLVRGSLIRATDLGENREFSLKWEYFNTISSRLTIAQKFGDDRILFRRISDKLLYYLYVTIKRNKRKWK